MTWTFYQYRVGISKHVLYPLLFENHWKAVTGLAETGGQGPCFTIICISSIEANVPLILNAQK